jgi:malate dehydrogenase (oxaloacetate-decarboxylating)(NADP+)
MARQPNFSEALEYHEKPRPGKIAIRSTKPTATQSDLSLAYTPGVAEPCLVIADDPEAAFRFTNRGNLVAVVSNGTAVLGLGNIGPLASKPVMEGKAVLFKRFADIDVFDLEIDAPLPEDVIRFCELLAPTVGGINLEDIKAPECFYIEKTLRERLDIPVFHDDQHGTAIISGAAFLNAIDLTDRDIAKTRVVFAGAGAAGVATARFFIELGVDPANVLMVDSKGVIHNERDDLDEIKSAFAISTDARTINDAFVGADAFVGVSVAGTVTGEMLQKMNENPIVFALANPDPEITYHEALAARPDVIMATGRSDFPNQVNNVLGFPFIFRGALDVRAKGVSEKMKIAAAKGLAALAREPVPDAVLRAYDLEQLSFGPEYLIPKPFDSRVLWTIAPAVARTAMEEGLARKPIEDFDEYRNELRARFQASHGLIAAITTRAIAQPKRVAYPHGADMRIIRAARRVADEGIATPLLIGDAAEITALAESAGIPLDGMEMINPKGEHDERERYAIELESLRRDKGLSLVVVDDATLAGSRGSINVDDEGNVPASSTLIEGGVLRGYMHDRHSAGFFHTQASGNGRRESFQSHPMPRMTNTLLLPGPHEAAEILASVKRGVYARKFGGGQVDIGNGDFVFALTESYLIEDGKLTAPLKGVNLIGNGPEVMRRVSMLGNDLEVSDGIWTCGKDGQSVPVGVGCPTIKIEAMTVGGTQTS